MGRKNLGGHDLVQFLTFRPLVSCLTRNHEIAGTPYSHRVETSEPTEFEG
jgi:hypothetical protein